MLINEVCRRAGVTKKAVEYYALKGLIAPVSLQNGYRDFSEDDLKRIEKISVYRGLGLSLSEISSVLDRESKNIKDICRKNSLRLEIMSEKQELLKALSEGESFENVKAELDRIYKKESIMSRLAGSFPGFYGRYLCLHFGHYLNDTVKTEEQNRAFEEIIEFLDGCRFELPSELEEYVEETLGGLEEKLAKTQNENISKAIEDPEKYVENHREELESYISFKNSDEYRGSKAFLLEKALREFTQNKGYSEIFIPAMCRLSPSYRDYFEKLQKANEKFESALSKISKNK